MVLVSLASLTAAPRGPEVSSAVRSATVGKPVSGCLAWKHRAIGRISATRASARFSIRASPFVPGAISTRTKTDGIGLFTGQIGYAWNQALFYVKGGAAVTSNRFSILETFTGIELASASATRWGGTVGVGFEYGFAPNWSFGVEYDHLFMGDANNSFTGLHVNPGAFPPLFSIIGSPKTWTWSPCASTIASAVTAHRSQRDTDLALFLLSSKLGRQECRPFLLEVTCLKNPSGPRGTHNRAPAGRCRLYKPIPH